MILRKFNNPNVLLRLGMAAMALGGLLHLFVHPAAQWSNLQDGVVGFFIGASIALNLLYLWMRRNGNTPATR